MSSEVSYHGQLDSAVSREEASVETGTVGVRSVTVSQYISEFDEDDLSTVDENYDVASLPSSIEEKLT